MPPCSSVRPWVLRPSGRTATRPRCYERPQPTLVRRHVDASKQRRGYCDSDALQECDLARGQADKDEGDGSLVEYILLVALIALAVIAAVIFVRTQAQSEFSDAGSKLSNNG